MNLSSKSSVFLGDLPLRRCCKGLDFNTAPSNWVIIAASSKKPISLSGKSSLRSRIENVKMRLPARTARSNTKPRTLCGLLTMEVWRKLFIWSLNENVVWSVKSKKQVMEIQSQQCFPEYSRFLATIIIFNLQFTSTSWAMCSIEVST